MKLLAIELRVDLRAIQVVRCVPVGVTQAVPTKAMFQRVIKPFPGPPV